MTEISGTAGSPKHGTHPQSPLSGDGLRGASLPDASLPDAGFPSAGPVGIFPAAGPGTGPEGDTAIEDLEQELSVLWRRARASSHRMAREVHPDMEPSAYGLMVLLHQQGPMRLTELSSAVGVGKPSLSRQVSMLQTLGLVEKHTDPIDGRAQPISLTESGSARLEGTAAARKAHFRSTWTGWETEDLLTLAKLLHKLNTSVLPPGGDPAIPLPAEGREGEAGPGS